MLKPILVAAIPMFVACGGSDKTIRKARSLTEPQMERINDDTYVLIYKTTMDKQPSQVRAATVWVRTGEKWQAAFHGENTIVEPKALSATGQKADFDKRRRVEVGVRI